MTTLNLSPVLPANIANLTVTGAVGGATLNWDSASEPVIYQIWQSNSNVASTATSIGNVETSHFTVSNLSPTSSYYYWVNSVNGYGIQGLFGNVVRLTQSSVTASQVRQINVNISTTAITSNTSPLAISAYDTWYNQSSLNFTAKSNDAVNLFFVLGINTTSANVAPGEVLEVIARTRLYDNTISANVPSGIDYMPSYFNASGTIAWNMSGTATFINKQFCEGFKNLLTTGHNYSWILEVAKNRINGTPTANVAISTISNQSSVATIN